MKNDCILGLKTAATLVVHYTVYIELYRYIYSYIYIYPIGSMYGIYYMLTLGVY